MEDFAQVSYGEVRFGYLNAALNLNDTNAFNYSTVSSSSSSSSGASSRRTLLASEDGVFFVTSS